MWEGVKCKIQREKKKGKKKKKKDVPGNTQFTNIDLHFILILHPENKILSDKWTMTEAAVKVSERQVSFILAQLYIGWVLPGESFLDSREKNEFIPQAMKHYKMHESSCLDRHIHYYSLLVMLSQQESTVKK